MAAPAPPVVSFDPKTGVLSVSPNAAGDGIQFNATAAGTTDPSDLNPPINRPVADLTVTAKTGTDQAPAVPQVFPQVRQIVVVGGGGTNYVTIDCSVPNTVTGGSGFNVLNGGYGPGSVLVGGSGVNQLFARAPGTLVNCGTGPVPLALAFVTAAGSLLVGKKAGDFAYGF